MGKTPGREAARPAVRGWASRNTDTPSSVRLATGTRLRHKREGVRLPLRHVERRRPQGTDGVALSAALPRPLRSRPRLQQALHPS